MQEHTGGHAKRMVPHFPASPSRTLDFQPSHQSAQLEGGQPGVAALKEA